MNNKFNYIFLNIFIFIFIFIPSFNNANEILIYADSISYDENENIVARGNAKIYQDSELIISDLIIYSKSEEKNYGQLPIVKNHYNETKKGWFLTIDNDKS